MDQAHITRIAAQVHLVEGCGNFFLKSEHLKISIRTEPVTLPLSIASRRARVEQELRVEQHRKHAVSSTWNSNSLVALCGYKTICAGKDENFRLEVDTAPVDYATFVATVLSLDKEFLRPDGILTTLRREFLAQDILENPAILHPVPFLANGLGVVLVAFTGDNKILLGRRGLAVKARGGERDVTVVEGMHAQLDRTTRNALSVHATAVRGCQEELGIEVHAEDVRLLGLAVDMKFYQWSFLGFIDLRQSAREVHEAHKSHAKDRWEAALESVELAPETVFDRVRSDGIWDLGLAAIYSALCYKCGSVPVHKAAERVFAKK